MVGTLYTCTYIVCDHQHGWCITDIGMNYLGEVRNISESVQNKHFSHSYCQMFSKSKNSAIGAGLTY